MPDAASPWPLRVRLFGGRNIHAARQLATSDSRETACEYYLPAVRFGNHWQSDETPVTCRTCNAAIRKANADA